MPTTEGFALDRIDQLAFAAYFVVLCGIGLWAGRKEKVDADDYFLAGRTLPWYVVGSSFIASNISTEHFIGMVGAAFLFGICVAMAEWGNVLTFSILIWFFIPFLLASRVFTTPEFMERRFHPALRQFFAIVTVVSNVVAFLAAVLYGGGLALEKLFGPAIARFTLPLAERFTAEPVSAELLDRWNLWFAIIVLGVVAGSWAIYGGLRSVAWTDFFTVIVMLVGGALVTILGLYMLSGEPRSLAAGWQVMIERNQAAHGPWAEYLAEHAGQLGGTQDYNRLSVIQPLTHPTDPWPGLILTLFSIGIWYNVINQFMIQRVLGARNQYHARMGIVLAGYIKVLLPLVVVVPGLILFARAGAAELLGPWESIKSQADAGYVRLLQALIPAGLRGLFLAALFGAIQSTVNSVLNSTATVFTLDIYQRLLRPTASQKHLVTMGMLSSIVILLLSIVLAGFIDRFHGNLFVYIQTLYAFFAPPFSAVFLLGILFRRINGPGALAAVCFGFPFGIAIWYLGGRFPEALPWLVPYANQGILNWAVCSAVCIMVSVVTAPPRPEQVTSDLTFNWKKLDIFEGLGATWYQSVLLWWGLFVLLILVLVLVFSGLFL